MESRLSNASSMTIAISRPLTSRAFVKFHGHHGNAGGHLSELGRAPTWHAYNKGTGSEFSRQAIKSEPTRTRPTYPFPSLHLMQQGGDSGDELEEMAYAGRTKEKLVWMDALNKWVPEKQLHPKPYMTFIGNPPTVEKQWKAHKESPSNYQSDFWDMRVYVSVVTQKEYGIRIRSESASHNNEKREAIRRRAQELAEQRKQRKAYSTPLYTSISERKLKSRAQSSKLPKSTPVSPTPHGQRKDKAPPPKHVWEGEEKPASPSLVKLEPTPPPTADSTFKKEISITLVSPKPEETEVLVEDLKDKGSEKKVTFTEALTPEPEKISRSPSPKIKKKDENTLLEEQRLKDSLEQQRQLQQQERERLLRAQQEVEEARQARAREEERLRMQRISNNLHKQPLSQRAQHHENVYENTMNAAAKRRKGKGAAAKSETVKSVKAEKSSKTKVPEIEEKPATQERKAKHKLPKPTVPKKAILAGMGSDLKPMSLLSNTTPPVKRKKVPEQVLPISKPEEIEVPSVEPVPVEQEIKPLSAVKERRNIVVEHRDNIKKEKRREIRRCSKPGDKVEELSVPETTAHKVQAWIFGQEDFSEKNGADEGDGTAVRVGSVPLPALSDDLNPELIAKEKQSKKERRRKSVLAAFIDGANQSVKKLRKPGIRDSSYTDELQRLELAEERRRKQQVMYERLKGRKSFSMEAGDSDGTRFEDYGFLAKFCIFTKSYMEMYRHAFEAVDDMGTGWLEGEDVMIALRGVNNKLTEAEEEYLYRVLELTGYKITNGADFKMFSVLAALSQRITMLDKWMKNLIGQMDFKALEMKMFKCKTLWECNVDRETNKISIDQLCVELRAGGVSMEHELEVREKLAHLHALDLLDFLTYVPLFIMIHQSVVQNPLDDSRTK